MTTTITVTPLQVLPCQSYTFPSCSVCYAKVTVQSLSLTAVCSRCRAIHNSADVEPRYRLSMLVAHAESIQRVTAFGGSLSRLFGVDARTFAGSQDCADHKNATAALSHILVGSRLSITIPSRYVKRKQVFDPQKVKNMLATADTMDSIVNTLAAGFEAVQIRPDALVSDVRPVLGFPTDVIGLLFPPSSPKDESELRSAETAEQERPHCTELSPDVVREYWTDEDACFTFEEIPLSAFLAGDEARTGCTDMPSNEVDDINTFTTTTEESETSQGCTSLLSDDELVDMLCQLQLTQSSESVNGSPTRQSSGDVSMELYDIDEHDDAALIDMLEALAL